MKLKPTIKGMKKENVVVEEKKGVQSKKKEEGSKQLPPSGYKPIFPPMRFLVRETPSQKNSSQIVKQYMELSVKRFDDDEGLPNVWIQMYQESEFYTGYLKGKTVFLPLEMLYDLIDNLTELSEECDKRKIE